MNIPFTHPRPLAPFKMPKPIAPRSRMAEMMQHLLSGGAGVRGGSLHGDNFDDNSRDITFWDLVKEFGRGNPLEQNQRLENTGTSAVASDRCGYVTVNAHDLTAGDISVIAHFNTGNEVHFEIGVTKVTNTSPWGVPENYSLYLVPGPLYRIEKNGANIIPATPTVSPNTLRIYMSGGSIFFEVGGAAVYNEVYTLSTATCFIYLYSVLYNPAIGKFTTHDDFLGSN